MTLSDLAALGSLVSGLAVLISLVLLYSQLRQLTAQVRQADKYQQTLVKQARTTRVMEVNARLADADFAAVYLRIMTNAEDLTLTDWNRFNSHAHAIFQNGEDTYSQHRRGLLHPDDFDGFVLALNASFRSPPLRVSWAHLRRAFPASYVAFIDQIVAEGRPVPLRRESLERWKRDVAAQLAAADKLSSAIQSTAT
ncbi:MAG TPA: hypothetical protein VGI95_21475 [Caulobacteraceae bacterium]|jgi:hypothetical protein